MKPASNPSYRRLAVAVGDPNGIGPEIALKALAAVEADARSRIALFGPTEVVRETARRLGLDTLLDSVDLRETGGLPPAAAQPGLVHPAAGESAIAAASAAVAACDAGEFDAVVAGPHHERAVAAAGIRFSGYPSLVARLSGVPDDEVFLMLVGAGLRIVHATLHESVASALARLTPRLVVGAALAGVRGCELLGVARPRVGIFGINPHASEGGLFGEEDARIVAPAVQTLRAQGVDVDEAQGADVLLAQRRHDLYVAMFHDQGHIPIKLLAPQGATAISLGGRTLLATVGHGSAMDIAGRGVARPDAMLRTLALLGAAVAPDGSAGT